MSDNCKILLTDDGNDYFGKSCANSLRAKGYEVQAIEKDGMEVLRQVESSNPDVLIMDTFMTHLDALGVMKEMRIRSLRKPLILLLSSVDNVRFEQEALSCGADYYFLKPFDVRVLAERVSQLTSWQGVSANGENRQQQRLLRQQPEDLEVEVSEILKTVGVPAHIKGYQYIRDAIILLVEKPDMIGSVTKQLYPTVAERFATTPSRVERAIRHAIEVAWDRGKPSILEGYFGYTVQSDKGKPTNSEFIAMISDNIRLRRKAS
jgi:two-component system response regulator (stage 0 sporulation protein A)